MRELTFDDVITLNENCLREGEPFGILDSSRLESALGRQFDGYLYGTDEQAIASLFRSMIQNHPFRNGNKRTAVLSMQILADDIGAKVVISDEDLCDLVYQLASEGGSKFSVNFIANKLFGMNLEESLDVTEERKQTALKSNGVFSVMNNEWIKEPVAEDIPELDRDAFNAELTKWLDRLNSIVDIESEELTESPKPKSLYEYNGPIYRFDRVAKEFTHIETQAVSFKQAVNNIKFKAAKEIGYARDAGANIGIEESEVVLADVDEEDNFEIDHYAIHHDLCQKCGKTYLNDAGECPLCDLGDESVLDESEETTNKYRVDDIEEFIEDLYDLRKESIAKDGEYSIGNLVFKEIRNLGYLDMLRELKNKIRSNELSLDEHLNKDEIKSKLPGITKEKLMSWINADVGWDMTIDPNTLEKADFEDLPKGWIVTQDIGKNNIFEKDDYDGILNLIKELLRDYGDELYIGTYVMLYGKNKGKVAVDVNRIIEDTVEAIEDGLWNKQESIYSCVNDEYLYLTHNIISRKNGKKITNNFKESDLKEYGLDDVVVDKNDKLSVKLKVQGINGNTKLLNTNIPNKGKVKN